MTIQVDRLHTTVGGPPSTAVSAFAKASAGAVVYLLTTTSAGPAALLRNADRRRGCYITTRPEPSFPSRIMSQAAYPTGLDPEALAFAEEVGVTTYVPFAEGLIREHFPEAGRVRWDLEYGVEEPRRWLVACWDAAGELGEILDRYHALCRKWGVEVPWPQMDHVCFDFTFV